MLRKMREDTTFFDKILWTDESTCRRDGFLNLHNLHSWHLENPRGIRTDRAQQQFKINLWTDIVGGKL